MFNRSSSPSKNNTAEMKQPISWFDRLFHIKQQKKDKDPIVESNYTVDLNKDNSPNDKKTSKRTLSKYDHLDSKKSKTEIDENVAHDDTVSENSHSSDNKPLSIHSLSPRNAKKPKKLSSHNMRKSLSKYDRFEDAPWLSTAEYRDTDDEEYGELDSSFSDLEERSHQSFSRKYSSPQEGSRKSVSFSIMKVATADEIDELKTKSSDSADVKRELKGVLNRLSVKQNDDNGLSPSVPSSPSAAALQTVRVPDVPLTPVSNHSRNNSFSQSYNRTLSVSTLSPGSSAAYSPMPAQLFALETDKLLARGYTHEQASRIVAQRALLTPTSPAQQQPQQQQTMNTMSPRNSTYHHHHHHNHQNHQNQHQFPQQQQYQSFHRSGSNYNNGNMDMNVTYPYPTTYPYSPYSPVPSHNSLNDSFGFQPQPDEDEDSYANINAPTPIARSPSYYPQRHMSMQYPQQQPVISTRPKSTMDIVVIPVTNEQSSYSAIPVSPAHSINNNNNNNNQGLERRSSIQRIQSMFGGAVPQRSSTSTASTTTTSISRSGSVDQPTQRQQHPQQYQQRQPPAQAVPLQQYNHQQQQQLNYQRQRGLFPTRSAHFTNPFFSGVSSADVKTLTKMGYSKDQATNALAANNNNIHAALETLLDQVR